MRNLRLLAVVLLAGFAGGMMSRFFDGDAHAGREIAESRVITTEVLRVVGRDGAPRVEIASDGDLATFVIYRSGMRPACVISVGPDGEPVLAMVDKGRNKRIAMGLSGGMPSLFVADPSGRSRFEVDVDKRNTIVLSMKGSEAGPPRAALFATEKGDPGLAFFNADAKPVWKAPK